MLAERSVYSFAAINIVNVCLYGIMYSPSSINSCFIRNGQYCVVMLDTAVVVRFRLRCTLFSFPINSTSDDLYQEHSSTQRIHEDTIIFPLYSRRPNPSASSLVTHSRMP